MNVPFAWCLTAFEYRRAVDSLGLDDTLFARLAELTGDSTLATWRPEGYRSRDVPRAVYAHAVLCEHAHARLRRLRDRQDAAAVRPPRWSRRAGTTTAS